MSDSMIEWMRHWSDRGTPIGDTPRSGTLEGRAAVVGASFGAACIRWAEAAERPALPARATGVLVRALRDSAEGKLIVDAVPRTALVEWDVPLNDDAMEYGVFGGVRVNVELLREAVAFLPEGAVSVRAAVAEGSDAGGAAMQVPLLRIDGEGWTVLLGGLKPAQTTGQAFEAWWAERNATAEV